MSIIDPEQIAYMREAQRELLPDDATIEVVSSVADQYGGQARTWAAVPGTVPARVGVVGPTLPREIAGGLGTGETTVVTLPALTGVKVGDRLVIRGRRYEIRAIAASASVETARRVEVDEL